MTSLPPGPQPVDVLSRVRAWRLSSWRHSDRIGQARVALDLLAQLATAHDGLSRPDVPDAGVHALADQLDVLITDALTAGAPETEVRLILTDLAASLRLS